MKRIRLLLLCSLPAALSLLFAPNAASGPTIKPAAGHVVLRLPYRGQSDDPLLNPDQIGMFDTEGNSYNANFVATDWKGDIYLMDAMTPGYCVLKRFDKQGRFREAWRPIPASFGERAGVSKDGCIWTGLGEYTPLYRGLPIVVYRSGQRTPVVDWRDELREDLDARIRDVLKKKGRQWKQGWRVSDIEAGAEQVGILLTGEAVGEEDQISRYLWILMRSDGSAVSEVQVKANEPLPHLASDGALWMTESDFTVQPSFSWHKFWLWERGKAKGEPLIDRTRNKEPYAGKLVLGDAYPPDVQVDAKGNIYLLWEREIPTYPPPGIERALIVLNSQRRLIRYLPWMRRSPTQSKWLKPLPDGSGFYRIQFLEKEAQVFFHPLP